MAEICGGCDAQKILNIVDYHETNPNYTICENVYV